MPGHFFDLCYTIEIVATKDDMFYVNGCTMSTEDDNFDMFVVNLMQTIISQEENDRSIFVEEIIDENVVNNHVEEEENSPPTENRYYDQLFDEMAHRPLMNDDPLMDIILCAFGNESGDDGTEQSLSLAQKVKRNIMNMIKIKKGLTVDSGAADHVMPIGWLLMFLVVKSIGAIRGLHYVAADGTRIPNVGQQLVKFMTLDGTWTELLFQIAAINKPLVSVSKLNEAGYKVVFDENNSYIMHKKTRRVIKIKKEKGVFVIDAYVPKKLETGFSRPR